MRVVENGTKVIILAGGRGKRMGDLTAEKQKCVLPIDGVPIIYQIVEALQESFGSLTLMVGLAYRGQDVEEVLDKKKGNGVKISYYPHKEGSESAGAYLSMEDGVKNGETVIGIPGDVLTSSKTYKETLERQLENGLDVTVTSSVFTDEVDTHPLVKPHELNAGLVKEFKYPVKPSDDAHGYLRDMGIFGFNHEFFAIMKEMMPELYGVATSCLIQELANRGRAGVNVSTDQWLHVGYPEDLRKTWKKMDIAA